MIDIKPCPAGHKAHIWHNSKGFRPVCDDQWCEWNVGDCDTEQQAAEAWNNRVGDDLYGDLKTAQDVLQDFDGERVYQQAQAAMAEISKLRAENAALKARMNYLEGQLDAFYGRDVEL